MSQDMNINALRTNCFRQSEVKDGCMLQVRVPGGLIQAKYPGFIEHLAEAYGDDTFHFGSCQCPAIPGTKHENIDAVNKELRNYLGDAEIAQRGVKMETDVGFPTIGARNAMVCISDIHYTKANINTQDATREIEQEVFPSHYHIKVTVADCPSDRAKGHFNDFGIIGLTKSAYCNDLHTDYGSYVKTCEPHATRVLSLKNDKIEKDTCYCVGYEECTLVCPVSIIQ